MAINAIVIAMKQPKKAVVADRYIFDVLMRDLVGRDKRASAYLVYLYLWAQTLGIRATSSRVSLRQLSEGTGFSKRAVQSAMKVLARRKLLSSNRPTATAVTEYALHRTWN